MKIRNAELESFGNLLFDLPLKGRKSRMRTRFIRLIDNHLEQIVNTERSQLIDDYAEKNEDGKPVNDGKGNITLKKEYMETFSKELAILMDESLVIEETEEHKDMFLAIAKIILEGDFEVSGNIASMYDGWCDQFEEVENNYGERESE